MTTLQGPAAALSPIESHLHALHAKHRDDARGQVASYIPELATADPRAFGICIATRDGHVYEVGDTRQAFTIQSISKALVYGLALADHGEEAVLRRIGVEPSGDAFNAISLRPDTGTPVNPMINAGAIAATGLVKPGADGRVARILAYLSACAGRTLDIDGAVYRSESETGHRNRAIGWMLRNAGVIEEDPTGVLETYFQQCAIRVTCRDLAVMAATLANGGRNPVTGRQAIAPESIDNILSVMSTCGMYDYSGEWIYRVGLPAKSGVGGGILAVLPGQLGIGVFSPPLDTQGNSVRGIGVCTDLAAGLSLHLFQDGGYPLPAQRLTYDLRQVRSRRRRSAAQRALLTRDGGGARVLELQGDLVFGSIEPVIRSVHAQAGELVAVVFDLRNVLSADATSLRLIARMQAVLRDRGVRLLLCEPRQLGPSLVDAGVDAGSIHPNADLALEAVESFLLANAGADTASGRPVPLAGCELLAGLDAESLAWLQANTQADTLVAGETVVRAGDPGDALYFLLAGTVEVRLPGAAQAPGQRIDVFTAGMSFGEMAFIDGAPRSADVVAVEPVQVRVLRQDAFDRLDEERPQLKIRLLQQVTRQLSANLRRINAEVLALRG